MTKLPKSLESLRDEMTFACAKSYTKVFNEGFNSGYTHTKAHYEGMIEKLVKFTENIAEYECYVTCGCQSDAKEVLAQSEACEGVKMQLSEQEKENDSVFLDTFQVSDEHDMDKVDVVIKWVLENFKVFRGPGNGEIQHYSELKEKLKGLIK